MQPPHRMERWLRFWRWLKHTATVNDQELDNLFLNRIPADRPLLAVGFHGHHEDGGLDESFVLVAGGFFPRSHAVEEVLHVVWAAVLLAGHEQLAGLRLGTT